MRILGVNLPDDKAAVIALTGVYGIGLTRARLICDKCDIGRDVKLGLLDRTSLNILTSFIKDNFVIEGDLRKSVSLSIKRLTEIKCYRGLRHRSGLPVRGQRTNTNARTRKGRARVAVAGKKKV